MTEHEMKQRTKGFALRVLKLIDSLPDELTAIMVASLKTLQARARESKIENPKSKIR